MRNRAPIPTGADEIRAALAAEMAKPRRDRRRIEDLEGALDRATTADAINERRADLGLAPWPNAHRPREIATPGAWLEAVATPPEDAVARNAPEFRAIVAHLRRAIGTGTEKEQAERLAASLHEFAAFADDLAGLLFDRFPHLLAHPHREDEDR
jgi:hypothetical protein